MGKELADLEGIPQAARPLWTKLVQEDLRPVHELFNDVRGYQQTLAQRAEWRDDDVDPALANGLAESSLRLLSTLDDGTPERTRRMIQAAVRYFVIEEDADNDVGSILGLDDDAEVLNAVLRALGYERWVVETP